MPVVAVWACAGQRKSFRGVKPMIPRLSKAVAIGLLIAQPLALPSISIAQNSAQTASQDKPIRLGTTEVVVDAVVVDKKNKIVGDLTAEEFEIYEDGVKQRVASFRFESTGSGAQQLAKTPAAGPATPVAPRTGNLVSLVFDAQAARDGALMARKAALDYI